MSSNRSSRPTGVSRRIFLFTGLAAASLGGAVWAGAEPLRQRAILSMLRSYFPYLRIDEACARAFCEQYEENVHVLLRNPFRAFSGFPEHVYQDFLLSTDFFPEEDESKPLKFVALYQSVGSSGACRNPLTRGYEA